MCFSLLIDQPSYLCSLFATLCCRQKLHTVYQLAPQDPGVKQEEPKARVSSAVGARIEAPKTQRGKV